MTIKHEEAIDFSKQIITAFYRDRNIDDFIHSFSDDITWIGPGEREYMTDKEEMIHYFFQGKTSVPGCIIQFNEFEIAFSSDTHCLVIGRYFLRTDESTGMLLEAHQRCSFLIVQTQDQLKVVHMHVSNPYVEMKNDEYFPREVGEQTYFYLQSKLAEKTEVIEMLNNTLEGGLKGSNDDDLYSFYYVNEGLPKMLGYTLDEFMKMSGGTAVGAVYPPDLKQALQDCADCFKKGPSYSTQYRIRKKNGDLLWVIDRGRKAVNANGETKINSIITDITPLKQALSALEIEREKYRIVLENISEIMFEYDVKQDTIYIYKTNRKKQLKKIKLMRIMNRLEASNRIHLDDIGHIAATLQMSSSHSIEIRARTKKSAPWKWLRIQSNPIKNNEGQVIQWVGSLKDITEEKKMVQTLKDLAHKDPLTGILNPSISKTKINEYLTAHPKGFLLVIDIDYFKTVNDTMGHLVGNQVLIRVANMLQYSFRDSDIVARVGGDEFLVFLKGGNDSFIESKVTDLLHQLRTIKYKPDRHITCSIGIAEACIEYNTFDSLFNVADKALYHSKQNGKDQFSIFH